MIAINKITVTLNRSKLNLKKGESGVLVATVLPASLANRNVSWHSDNTNIATVNNGRVLGIHPGVTRVYAVSAFDRTVGAVCYVVVYDDTTYLADVYGNEVITFSYKEHGNLPLSKNFKVREFRCKDGTDEILIDMALVRYLQQIRDWAGASITINSGYRTPSHNEEVGGSDTSKHMQGKAADIYCSTKTPLELAQRAETLGMPGIEWNPIGNYTHIDTRTGDAWWRQYAKDKNGKAYFVKMQSFYDVEEG